MLNYINFVTSEDFRDFFSTSLIEALPGFSTLNPSYRDQLFVVKARLANYINDQTLRRPFIYLILGPPGSGKSFLVKCLTRSLEKSSQQKLRFQAANLAEMAHPHELHPVFASIEKNARDGYMTVTFLDEFDVRFPDGSAIKSLINPVYDGRYWADAQFREFGRSVFFFAGSYLRDLETLVRVQRAAGLSLSKFFLDLYLAYDKRNNREAMRRIAELQGLCDVHQRWRTDADPRSDTIGYLIGLDKIRDFLSRVGGNVCEIQDLSWPLGVTQEHFVFEGREVHPSARVKLAEVIAFVKSRELSEGRFLRYEHSFEPLLEFKNLLVCERAVRVVQSIVSRFGDVLREQGRTSFEIDRQTLNFLTLVPLTNGMRSLEQLVNTLDKPLNGKIACQRFQKEDVSMVIQDSPRFVDPIQVWEELRHANPRLLDYSERTSDGIRVPL